MTDFSHHPQQPQHFPGVRQSADSLFSTVGLEDALYWPDHDAQRQRWVRAAASTTTITSERVVGIAFTALSWERHAHARYQHAVELHTYDANEAALQGYALDALAEAVSALSEAVARWGRVIVLLDHLHRAQHPASAPVYDLTMTHTQRLTTTLWMLQRLLRLYCSTLHLLPPLCTIGTLDSLLTDGRERHEEDERHDERNRCGKEAHP